MGELTNILEALPKELFQEVWLEEYEKSIEAIGGQLIKLNLGLLVLEKILHFPFHVFEDYPSVFWSLIEYSLFETSVLIIWRIGIDAGERGLTLRKLKNQVMQKFIRSEHKEQFGSEWRKLGGEQSINSFTQRITDIRNNYIAHFNLTKHTEPNPDELRERTEMLKELMGYRDILNSYFDLLCLGNRRALLPWDYLIEAKKQLDIDHILSVIAKDSAILNTPERNSALWPAIRESLTAHQIDFLNDYRKSFGLPTV